MTEATVQALNGLRDLSTLKWYVIPLLAIVMYIYAKEIKDAKRTGNWNAVFCGLALFGSDFFNETWNGWVMIFSGRSAFWTAPGDCIAYAGWLEHRNNVYVCHSWNNFLSFTYRE